MIAQKSCLTTLHASFLLLCGLLFSPTMWATAQSSPSPAAMNSPSPSANAARLPEFEVASIKENKSGTGNSRWMSTPDGISMSNISLMNLISNAYGIKPDLISGAPGWVDSIGYDIQAKVAGEDVPKLKELKGKQRGTMLRPLLAERFHLQAHVVTKTLPVYDLEVAKGGPKLKQSPPPPGVKPEDARKGGYMSFGPGTFTGQKIAITSLADNLSFAVHRTVIDKTGLTGNYDFTLKYASEEHDSGKPDDGSADSAPSIFTALEEQLGLKLQSGKGPVETLVVDHVEKPTEN